MREAALAVPTLLRRRLVVVGRRLALVRLTRRRVVMRWTVVVRLEQVMKRDVQRGDDVDPEHPKRACAEHERESTSGSSSRFHDAVEYDWRHGAVNRRSPPFASTIPWVRSS